jgi:trehalose 6-phosphate phosphatase
VLGQYGNERWTSTDRRVISPKPPRGLASFMGGLPRLLRDGDAAGAWVEEKGLAVAVHTRRLDDPQAAFERLLPVLTESARSHGLEVEPGRSVIEVRAPGMHKGAAVRALTDELGARAFVFCGDDLGDLEAFKAVEELRGEGFAGLLVCVGSEEENALAELADVVVDGPDGALALLQGLTEDIRSVRA